MKALRRGLPSVVSVLAFRAAVLAAPRANPATDGLMETLARRLRQRIRPQACAAMLLLAAAHSASAQSTWVSAGPGPIINGSGENITSAQGQNPNSGSIVAFAVLPGSADTIYAATVNGGVMVTTNATAAIPTWTALTDQALPNLSLNSIAISPLDPNTIFVGAGKVSGYAREGGEPFGIGRSTDGGKTWVTARLGTDLVNNKQGNVRSIVPTAATTPEGQVVLAAVESSPYGNDDAGVFRSVDGGNRFTQLTMAGNGIPVGHATDLVGDPGVPGRFYAAVRGTIYVSNNSGASWTPATGPGFNVLRGARVLLSVHNSAAANVVYAMVIVPSDLTDEDVPPGTKRVSGTLDNVYRSTDQGATWTALGKPTPEIFGGKQGGLHGCIAADPKDPNIVYVNGDTQDLLVNNPNGTTKYSANIFRNVSGVYQNMVGNGNGGGANGTSPHSDSRAMAFDANGDLVESNDGGINKLVNPNGTTTAAGDGTRRWVSINGNINPCEVHSAVFDPLTRVAVIGTQDNGSAYQMGPDLQANHFHGGDGGDVDVDADQNAHPGTSIRYGSSQNLGNFSRLTFDTANNRVGDKVYPALRITAGAGAGGTIPDGDRPFVTPFKVNRIRPARLMIGGNANLYESLDQGETVTNLIATGHPVGNLKGNSPISYGGRNADGTANEGAFFAGAGQTLFRRTADGQPVTTVTAYKGVGIFGVVMDPQNTTHVFVLDHSGKVFGSFDGGATFADLTANLGALCPSVRSIELFHPANSTHTVLIAAGQGGVFKLGHPDRAGAQWQAVSSGLPKALVLDVRYDYVNNVLVAGTLGRGVFTLTGYFLGGATPASASSQPQVAPRADVIRSPEVPSKAHPVSRTAN